MRLTNILFLLCIGGASVMAGVYLARWLGGWVQ